MRILLPGKRSDAWTLEEVLIVVAVVMILIAIALPMMMPQQSAKDRARRINCVNNLKQVALAYKIWADDHKDKFPMEVSANDDGTMEWIGGTNAYRHFQVMSNELNTPRILFCPSESEGYKISATIWTPVHGSPGQVQFTDNSNLSYFAGVDATETNSNMLLSGDRNLTNGLATKNGLLELTTNVPTGWTEKMHVIQGNVALADGSVQMTGSKSFRDLLQHTGFTTNRLAMP